MIEQIARACHAAHNALCFEPVDWELKTSDHKSIVYDSIERILAGEITSPEQSHNNFVRLKKKNGWVYGQKYSKEDKINPRMAAFKDLTHVDQLKEKVFFNIVESFKTIHHG